MRRMNPILALALAIAGGVDGKPALVAFGRDGEFRASWDENLYQWHLKHIEGGVECWTKTRADAFNAAADWARTRGYTPEECGKLIAGVRW